MSLSPRSLLALLLTATLGLATVGCGDDTSTASTDVGGSSATEQVDAQLVTVSPDQAAGVVESSPDDLVVLDVRTPEEFAEGHLEGAVLVDFYAPDFADQLAGLDANVPYVLYCRSGNRSGQTLSLMAQMGFADVTEVDGGIVAWQQAGLPVTTS